jgi:hypothetical protein
MQTEDEEDIDIYKLSPFLSLGLAKGKMNFQGLVALLIIEGQPRFRFSATRWSRFPLSRAFNIKLPFL